MDIFVTTAFILSLISSTINFSLFFLNAERRWDVMVTGLFQLAFAVWAGILILN